MKKYLLLLVAGAIALPGLAIAESPIANESTADANASAMADSNASMADGMMADANASMADANASMAEEAVKLGYSQALSGNVRTQHQSVTNGDLTTVANNLGGGDTHLTWQHNYQVTATKSVNGFIRFEAGNDQRISITGTDKVGDWTATAKGEWDTTGFGSVTSYRDQFVTLSNVSGMYVTLGNKQYGDVAKGLDTGIGSDVDFQEEYYFVTDESRYEALQLGFSMPNGVDISAVLQLDNGVGLFGGMATLTDTDGDESDDKDADVTVDADGDGDPANDFDQNITGATDQTDVTGTLILVKYKAGSVDAQLEIYSGGIAGVDNADDSGDMDEDREVSATATLLAVAYDLGTLTPFLNYSTKSVTTTSEAGTDTDSDTSAMQFGAVTSLGGGTLGVAYGTESETESSMIDVDYTTSIGGVTVKGMLGSGTNGNGDADDTDASYYALRLEYGF